MLAVSITAEPASRTTAGSGLTGREYVVINTHTAANTVQGNGAELIGNTGAAANTFSLAAGAAARFTWNGTLWRVY